MKHVPSRIAASAAAVAADVSAVVADVPAVVAAVAAGVPVVVAAAVAGASLAGRPARILEIQGTGPRFRKSTSERGGCPLLRLHRQQAHVPQRTVWVDGNSGVRCVAGRRSAPPGPPGAWMSGLPVRGAVTLHPLRLAGFDLAGPAGFVALVLLNRNLVSRGFLSCLCHCGHTAAQGECQCQRTNSHAISIIAQIAQTTSTSLENKLPLSICRAKRRCATASP